MVSADVEAVRKLLTDARHERHFTFFPSMNQCIVVVVILLFLQVPGSGLGKTVSTYRTGGNLKLPAAAPGRLLCSGRQLAKNVIHLLHKVAYFRKPVHQPKNRIR